MQQPTPDPPLPATGPRNCRDLSKARDEFGAAACTTVKSPETFQTAEGEVQESSEHLAMLPALWGSACHCPVRRAHVTSAVSELPQAGGQSLALMGCEHGTGCCTTMPQGTPSQCPKPGF